MKQLLEASRLLVSGSSSQQSFVQNFEVLIPKKQKKNA